LNLFKYIFISIIILFFFTKLYFYSFYFSAMLQGVEVLCNLPILYIFKDTYQLHPGNLYYPNL
ncbi:hypothetical protein, partial [Plasmodium yoelii yoelii]